MPANLSQSASKWLLRIPPLLVLACAAAGGGVPALASGPAFSGLVATATDASDMANNPAALTRAQRPDWVVTLSLFGSSSTDKSTAGSAGSRSVDDSAALGIPAAYYARPWKERLALGISLFVPAGLGSDPPDETIGRYLLEKWALGYVSLAPAVGWRVNAKFSVGAALNINYAAYTYESAVFNGPGVPDGKMKIEDSDFGVGFSVGALYEASPTTRLGLTYRSSATSNFSATPEFSGLTAERQQILDQAGVRNRPVNLSSKFPQGVVAGIWREFPSGVSATFDAAWVDFSRFEMTEASLGESAVVASNATYQDIWAGTAGVKWPLNRRWALQLGAAYVSSGVSDENRTFALRLDRIWGVGAGAEHIFKSGKVLIANLTYYDLGAGAVTIPIADIGTLSAEYTKNYAVGLNLAFRWMASK